MNAEERQIAEIKRIQTAIEKTESWKLKKQYRKHLHRLELELHEYRMWKGTAKRLNC